MAKVRAKHLSLCTAKDIYFLSSGPLVYTDMLPHDLKRTLQSLSKLIDYSLGIVPRTIFFVVVIAI